MNQSMNGISKSILPLSPPTKTAQLPKNEQATFSQTLKTAIDKVNDAEIASDMKTEALATGNINDLHDVMITAQKASITLETSVQVQRKVIDAYNEIMRMQVWVFTIKVGDKPSFLKFGGGKYERKNNRISKYSPNYMDEANKKSKDSFN